ncbi:MAG: AAA family ATPase [Helicobacteraceae bacterium]|nr:AAA family ATPase [Helicobacteraceae bacterium]
MFNFEKDTVLTQEDFEIKDKVTLIDDFLFSQSVTLIYSPPKQGKTWLAYGMASELNKHDECQQIFYLDMDNSISTLKDRAVHETLMQYEKLKYISRSKIGCLPLEYLRKISHEAQPNAFDGVVFFLDTTKDFVDTDSTSKAKEFLSYTTMMRDAGATVIILHHATKNGRHISGDSSFTNTPDNVYEMAQKAKRSNELHYFLSVTHARGVVKDVGFSVNTNSLQLGELDKVLASMTTYEEEFVNNASQVLKENADGLNSKQLLITLGYTKDDKTARDRLEKYEGKFWKKYQEKKGKPIIYTII